MRSGFKKYRNIEVQGFASQAEASLHALLRLMERIGEISDIQCQDHVYLTDARILYIADFKFNNKASEWEWAEMKGFETPVWRIKRRLWLSYGPGPLTVYKPSKLGPVFHERIEVKK